LRQRRGAAVADDEPFFDRGPGYAILAGGRTSAEVDRL
jgi:N-methylhydantoinase B